MCSVPLFSPAFAACLHRSMVIKCFGRLSSIPTPTRGRAAASEPLSSVQPSPSSLARTNTLCSHNHVSHSICGFLLLQLPTSNQQCLESVRKAHQERSPGTSARRPAPNLRLSRRYSRSPSAASPRARTVPKCRRSMDQVARSGCERTLCLLCDTRRRCWPGKPQDMNCLRWTLVSSICGCGRYFHLQR
jgi:hypothetical protein